MSRSGVTRALVTRRRFLAGVGTVVAGALAVEGVLLEPQRLSVSRHRVGSGDPERAPVRLVVLTDLHLKRITSFHEQIAAEVARAEPVCIALVGDSVDHPDRLPLLADFLALLPDGATRVATLGNWEYWGRVDRSALRRVYEAGETRLLVNEGVRLGEGVELFGTDDAVAGTPTLEGLAAPDEAEAIVLSHCPGYRDEIVEDGRRITAVISGHTHGGQVAVAGWAPWTPPGSGRYVAGWYDEDGPRLFVSRGLGTSVLPLRLGSVPEIAIIDWYPASA